jgi:SAM-dependent methyltransferase
VLGRTDQDVAFWRRLAGGGGPGDGGPGDGGPGDAGPGGGGPGGLVLELACGTGRIAVPLAQAGIKIVGLDIDPVMLAEAAEARAKVSGVDAWPLLVAGDMLRLPLAGRFRAVIVAYNSLQLLVDPGDAIACLAGVAACLTPDGNVGLEVTDFQAGAVATEVAHQTVYTGDLNGESVTLSGSLSHDLVKRTSRYRRSFAGPGWTADDELVIRSYRRDELSPLLTAARLAPVQWWEDGPVTRVVAEQALR